ncbi:MAG: sigma-54 dependent transcriptional regulator [Rhodospirillales bacterium]|nr:sigma-54 dependent transcriptional regulator [Rhodospirillales bacterium]
MQPLRDGRVSGESPVPVAFVPNESDLIGLSTETMARLLIDLAHGNPLLATQLRRRLQALPPPLPRKARTAASSDPASVLVGESPAMRRVRKETRQFAASDAAVLVTGETGTGKELAARALHGLSRCASGPFIAVNCAGLPPTLVSSELFGHEKGAFTGAHQRKLGRIEAARGGTIFLDEIGDFPFEIQAHLLRFLQEKTIERVGACHPLAVDVRVIAATNKDLAREVKEGRFREDLYYRLHVLRLHLPPLRDRPGDIELLSRHFLAEFRTGSAVSLSLEAMDALRAHCWPGNVRELMGRVRRAAVTAEQGDVQPGDLGFSRTERRRQRRQEAAPGEAVGAGSVDAAAPGNADPRDADGFSLVRRDLPLTLAAAKRDLEAWMLRASLASSGNNVTLAAERLGVSRVTLYRLLERHGVRHAEGG